MKISKLALYFIHVYNMGRLANDGRGRMGGRAKGTGNKPLNDWVNTFIKRNRAQFEDDFKTLSPQERAAVMATLIASTGVTSTPQPETV